MLKAKFLALSCFMVNPEALSKFEGWGLLIDFAEENKIDKSLVEDVIDDWIEGKAIRRLTGVYDRQFYVNERLDAVFRGCIMTKEEEDGIVKKLTEASKYIRTNDEVHALDSNTQIKFSRKKDGAKAELFIARKNSKCCGMAFVQPPDKDIASLLIYPVCW